MLRMSFQKVSQKINIRSSCVTCLNKFHKTNQFSSLPADTNLRDLFMLRRKLRDNNLIVTKADKGNCVVVLDIVQYQNKVLDFLGSPSFKSAYPRHHLISLSQNSRQQSI